MWSSIDGPVYTGWNQTILFVVLSTAQEEGNVLLYWSPQWIPPLDAGGNHLHSPEIFSRYFHSHLVFNIFVALPLKIIYKEYRYKWKRGSIQPYWSGLSACMKLAVRRSICPLTLICMFTNSKTTMDLQLLSSFKILPYHAITYDWWVYPAQCYLLWLEAAL